MPPQWQGKRSITVVTAYIRQDGIPDFKLNEVEVTHEEYENGIHYYLAEATLLQSGFDEPFVHFDEFEAPPFLLSAVRQHLQTPQAEPVEEEAIPF
jgi:hypothetical protein